MNKITLQKLWEKLAFCYRQQNEKMQVYQQFDLDIVPPACIFIKSETPAHVFLHILQICSV